MYNLIFLLLLSGLLIQAQFTLHVPPRILVPFVVQTIPLINEYAITLTLDDSPPPARVGISIATEIGVVGLLTPVDSKLETDVSVDTLQQGAPHLVFYADPATIQTALQGIYYYTAYHVGNGTNKITVQVLSGSDGAILDKKSILLVQQEITVSSCECPAGTCPASVALTLFLLALGGVLHVAYVTRLKRRFLREKEEAVSLMRITSIIDDGQL